MTTSASATPTDWHRRQRDLVAASLIAVRERASAQA